MKGTALLHSISWLQVSLALHAALGFALYVVAPHWEPLHAWQGHAYQVSLFDDAAYAPASMDDEIADDEEETLCVERDEPDPGADAGIYDGPPETSVWDSGEYAFVEEPLEHEHKWVRTVTGAPCKHCGTPLSWSARCSVKGCWSAKGGGHRCVVASCGTRRSPPAKRDEATPPAAK